MNFQQSFSFCTTTLQEIYSRREAEQMAHLLLEKITGFSKLDRIRKKEDTLEPNQRKILDGYLRQLMEFRPIQYVLGEAWFFGLKFTVDERVLIPRPETEELVDWVLRDLDADIPWKDFLLLDIGTGSGCIPISIKKKFPDLQVKALEISPAAIEVAKQNAFLHDTDVDFFQGDILSGLQQYPFGKVDILISNPPYILPGEKPLMAAHVLDYEPHLALFVPEEDPLLFYQAMILFANQHLKNKGRIYWEINESRGKEMVELLLNSGFNGVELRKDIYGRERMVKAEKV
ncbi:MAG: peptide chain release factor N(5)-glutamine methyltransferase [Chitinophagaceae bacterium]